MSLFLKILIGTTGACAVFLLLLILPQGKRPVGVIENIDGMPYPAGPGFISIEEKLAHVDVYLREPVLAKQLNLTVTFTPENISSLKVAVRSDAFWLSYPEQQILYAGEATGSEAEPITKTVSIPLTDKLQETDQSVDLMFFAANEESTNEVDEKTADTVLWKLHDIQAEVVIARPTWPATKDYIKSVIQKERAL